MNGWELGLTFVVLVALDAWLFWYAAKGERKRFERERMRHKARRSSIYKSWEDSNGKDRT